jgi:hypothetical protein
VVSSLHGVFFLAGTLLPFLKKLAIRVVVAGVSILN